MGHEISKDRCAEAVIKGIEKAQKKYEKWSGGDWLWAASEYKITVHVAEALANIDGAKFVTLEHSGLDAMEVAAAVVPGPKPKKARLRGRFDILFWWGDETPRAIVEIKNQPNGSEQCSKDFHRICEVLKMNKEESSLQFGLFGFYTSATSGDRKSAEEKIEDKFCSIKELAKTCTGSTCKIKLFKSKIHCYEGNDAWAAGCLLFT